MPKCVAEQVSSIDVLHPFFCLSQLPDHSEPVQLLQDRKQHRGSKRKPSTDVVPQFVVDMLSVAGFKSCVESGAKTPVAGGVAPTEASGSPLKGCVAGAGKQLAAKHLLT